mgnify:CR=1 FL=1
MTPEQVTRYINLVNRKTFILAHSGVDWKPEYAQELEEINKELDKLRPLVEEARKSRAKEGK